MLRQPEHLDIRIESYSLPSLTASPEKVAEEIATLFPKRPKILILLGASGWPACSKLLDEAWKDTPVIICNSDSILPCRPGTISKETRLQPVFLQENCVSIHKLQEQYNVALLQQRWYIKETIALMQQLQPEIKRIAFISDQSFMSQRAREAFSQTLRTFPSMQPLFLTAHELTLPQMLDSLQSYGTETGILFHAWHRTTEQDESPYFNKKIGNTLSGFAKTLIFTLDDQNPSERYFSGGYYISIETYVNHCLELVDELLAGRRAPDIAPATNGTPQIFLNYSDLLWYNIPISRHPHNAHYFEKVPGWFERYQTYYLLIILFLIVIVIIRYYSNRTTRRFKAMNRRIINSLDMPVYSLNSEGVIERMINRPMEEEHIKPVCGFDRLHLKELIVDEANIPKHMQFLTNVLVSKQSEYDSLLIRNSKGEIVHISVRLVYYDKKHVLAFVRNISDIEKKRIQNEEQRKLIEAMNRQYSFVIKAIRLISWEWNLPESIIICNREHFVPKSNASIGIVYESGENYFEQIVPAHRERMRDMFEKLQKDEIQILNEEYQIVYEGDNHPSWAETFAIVSERDVDGHPTKLVGATHLIDERKEMELQLRKAKQKAEESNILKSAFLANISHEIRTPLNAIVGFSCILAQLCDNEENREYIRIIETNNDLLLQLINDILDISQIESGTLEFVYETMDINERLAELQTINSSKMPQEVTLRFIPALESCFIRTEKTRVLQVLSNFLSNAIKCTSKGYIDIGYYPPSDGYIRFFIRDTGIGIPLDKQEEIFNRFIKLDSFRQGTGLGLSICRTIADKMDGKTGVYSEEGKGAEFWLDIPYVPCS